MSVRDEYLHGSSLPFDTECHAFCECYDLEKGVNMSKLDTSYSSGRDKVKLEDEQIGCWEKEIIEGCALFCMFWLFYGEKGW